VSLHERYPGSCDSSVPSSRRNRALRRPGREGSPRWHRRQSAGEREPARQSAGEREPARGRRRDGAAREGHSEWPPSETAPRGAPREGGAGGRSASLEQEGGKWGLPRRHGEREQRHGAGEPRPVRRVTSSGGFAIPVVRVVAEHRRSFGRDPQRIIILPLSACTAARGRAKFDTSSTRTTSSDRFVTLCAPSGPFGKRMQSPGASFRSPSGARNVGVPTTTTSSSSFPSS